MSAQDTFERIDVRGLISAAADVIAAHAEELTALDQAIGDGDHGLNMRRGLEAVRSEIETISALPLGEALGAIGRKLVMTVGGASGPLFGTFFMVLGKELVSGQSREDFTRAFGKAVDAVAFRGKSHQGQKTMLDVLYPVWELLSAGGSPLEIVARSEEAANSTVPMLAQRGRASFLRERSIGHMDPGARSASLLVRAVAEIMGRN